MNLNAYYLRKDEGQYELRIRKLSVDGTAEDIRKRLSQAFQNNVAIDDKVINNLDSNGELDSCEKKYKDLANLVEEYLGDYNDAEYNRILTRLWHLYLRVQRIPISASLDERPGERKTELEDNSKTLLDSFIAARRTPEPPVKDLLTGLEDVNKSEERVAPSETGTPRVEVNKNLSLPNDSASAPIGRNYENLNFPSVATMTSHPRTYHVGESHPRNSKCIPVYKWNVKFDYESGQSVGAFLQRVEELRRARGMSKQELFESAVDLFEGKALTWYRSTINRIRSWEELCDELRIVFQTPDYNFRLQQEIFTRFQGENEPIDLYIAAMEGLYGRLSISVPESTRLSQIMNNLHPMLYDRLALCEIKTLEDLRTVGRKAESGRLRASMPRPTPRANNILEPDLAYGETSRRKALPLGKVASIVPKPSETRNPIKCWNCNQTGHRFALCRRPRRKFCFGCGNPDTVRADCTKCNPKNG